jgi:serine/threonine-protein kinase RsbT
MTPGVLEQLRLAHTDDVLRVRQAARRWAVDLGFGIVDQTKIVTAVSELARNQVVYGGGGSVVAEVLETERRAGLRITFADEGPGIADVQQALTDGFGTGTGLGLGLGGARRLMDEFSIDSQVGKGTTVVITRWL